jgi:hypothetical protein
MAGESGAVEANSAAGEWLGTKTEAELETPKFRIKTLKERTGNAQHGTEQLADGRGEWLATAEGLAGLEAVRTARRE